MSELTQKELERIKNVQNYCQAYYWLKVKEECNFNLGDILVKMAVKTWDEDRKAATWEPESVSHKSNTPRKFKVVHIDEYGVPFAKCIKANGKLGTELICLAEINPQYNFFRVDPDYVEHTILAEEGEEFVADQRLKEVKRQRREVQKQNKALREKITTLNEANEFIKGLSKGDVLWVASKGNDDDAHLSKYSVEQIIQTNAKKPATTHSWYSGGSRSGSQSNIYHTDAELTKLHDAGLSVYYEMRIIPVNKTGGQPWTWHDQWLDPVNVLDSYIYKKQPNSYDTKIT